MTEHQKGGEVYEALQIVRGKKSIGSSELARVRDLLLKAVFPSATQQDPDEGVTQADLDRGAELDEKYGWSHTAEDAKRLRKQAAEVHADPDEEPEWPVVTLHRQNSGADPEVIRGIAAVTMAPGELSTYYPTSAPNVLSPRQAAMLVGGHRLHPEHLKELADYAKGIQP